MSTAKKKKSTTFPENPSWYDRTKAEGRIQTTEERILVLGYSTVQGIFRYAVNGLPLYSCAFYSNIMVVSGYNPLLLILYYMG
ncbi:MAG TPA: hypothetical protein GXX15_08820 [Clostridia bacterium]|nr:hypothetical protein [Clostridia bacterium]